MTDQSSLRPESEREAAARRSSADDGPRGVSVASGDYRERLRSRRWNAAPLENPEAEKTDPRIAILAIVLLSVLTLVVLVVGYGVLDIWGGA